MASPPESPSAGSEPPPASQPTSVPADELQRQHPLWERAAGRIPPSGARTSARGGVSGGASGGASGDAPRFERLSAAALALAAYDHDGAESTAAGSERARARDDKRSRRAKRLRPAEQRVPISPGARYEASTADESSVEDEEEQEKEGSSRSKRAKNVSCTGVTDSMLAAAAFGGASHDAFDDVSDDDSSAGFSQTSSVRRDAAMKAAFPIRGVSCVGCVLAGKVAPVVRFVNENAARMEDTTLWKMASLVYTREVVEPARIENVAVPAWNWRDVREHFTMHVVDGRLGRLNTLRLLSLMRNQAEQRLLRIEADGARELDKHTTEQVLKIVNLESRERQLLEGADGAVPGARARGKTRAQE